jgi:hypothetical protein
MKLNGGEVEVVGSYRYRKPPPDPNAAPNARPERPPFTMITIPAKLVRFLGGVLQTVFLLEK